MKYNENVTVELFNTISQIPASISNPGKFSFFSFFHLHNDRSLKIVYRVLDGTVYIF